MCGNTDVMSVYQVNEDKPEPKVDESKAQEKVVRYSPEEQKLMKMEEELTKAMITCEMGEKVWCMTNFECGQNKVCYEKASGKYFEDFSEKCDGKKGGCWCEKP